MNEPGSAEPISHSHFAQENATRNSEGSPTSEHTERELHSVSLPQPMPSSPLSALPSFIQCRNWLHTAASRKDPHGPKLTGSRGPIFQKMVASLASGLAPATSDPSSPILRRRDRDDNLADFFTKYLAPKHFFALRDIIMNVPHAQRSK